MGWERGPEEVRVEFYRSGRLENRRREWGGGGGEWAGVMKR